MIAKRLSRFCFKGCHKNFKFCGSPAQFRGPGHHITASYVHTATHGGEAMTIHCLPGYVSTMFLVQYPARGYFFLLDCGSPSDVHRVQYYIENVLSNTTSTSSGISHDESKRKTKGLPSGSSGPARSSVSSTPMFTVKEHLKLAAISHCHIDHSGGASSYSQLGVPVAWPAGIESAYSGICGRWLQLLEARVISHMSRRMGREVIENPFESTSGLLGPYWTFPADTHTATLEDGDPLPCGFEDWQAIHIPGHVSHMVGFYHPLSRVFYAADLLVKLKNGFFPPFRIDMESVYHTTLLRLRSLQVRCLLLPHGGIVDLSQPSSGSTTKGNETSWMRIIDDLLCKLEERQSHEGKMHAAMGGKVLWRVANVANQKLCCGWEKGIEEQRTIARSRNTKPLPASQSEVPLKVVH